MKRHQILLAVLASEEGRPFEPVHIQKAMYVLSRERGRFFDGDSKYNFQPYDYGPFDSSVYSDIEFLKEQGLAYIRQTPDIRMKYYGATEEGIARSEELLANLPAADAGAIRKIAAFVRSCTFRELVSHIYRWYPEMKENSVFAG